MENKYKLVLIISFMIFAIALTWVVVSNYTPFTNGIIMFISSLGNLLVLAWALDNMEKNM